MKKEKIFMKSAGTRGYSPLARVLTLAVMLLTVATTGAWAQATFTVTELTADAVSEWVNNYAVVTPDDLQGFVAVEKAAAEAWTGAPASGYATLLYGYDSQEGKWSFVTFENGSMTESGSNTYTKDGINYIISLGVPLYYTTGSGTGGGDTKYTVTMAEGTVDATNWTISPTEAAEGKPITATYSGSRHVKSVTAVTKAAAPAGKTAAEATAADKGKLIGADGKIYADAAAATAAGTTAVALIAYVGSDNGEAAPYNHGLALALSDANNGNGCKWSTSNDAAVHSTTQGSSTFTSESGLQYNATHNSDAYPAFKAAIANNSTAAPTGCSAWFLASGYQWTKMFAGDASGLKTLAGLEEHLYWSSSEYSAYRAWYFLSFDGEWGDGNKVLDYLVRSCLAF